MRIQSMMCLILSVGGAACASSQADQVRDARMEQIDEQTVARTRVVEDRQEARENAIEQNYDSAKTNVDDSRSGDKDAAHDRLEASEERALFQSKSVGRLETIRVRIDAARKKLGVASTPTKAPLQRELSALETEYQHMQQEVQAFPNAPNENWESAMEALDARLTHLNTRVKSLTGSIEEQHEDQGQE
jgi:hypothetical protein